MPRAFVILIIVIAVIGCSEKSPTSPEKPTLHSYDSSGVLPLLSLTPYSSFWVYELPETIPPHSIKTISVLVQYIGKTEWHAPTWSFDDNINRVRIDKTMLVDELSPFKISCVYEK